jgi:hypothetical protein
MEILIQKMSRELKWFFISLFLSLPFWWGINVFQKNLEDFLFWERMAAQPELLTTQIIWEEKLEKLKPLRNRQIDDFEIGAGAAISVFVNSFNQNFSQAAEKILFEKNSDRALPIASLTKLMTANVVLGNYDINQEKIVKLLFPLLIESNNNAAINLAEVIGKEAFVELMNLEAKKLGMNNTHFVNPTGLDSKEKSINYSTPKDLVKLAKYITFERPLIWEISIIKEFENIKNTNELLGEISGIIGGKTGETSLAGKCLLLVVQAPKNKGFIINVIINSENHFEEMKKLIDWTKYAYKW